MTYFPAPIPQPVTATAGDFAVTAIGIVGVTQATSPWVTTSTISGISTVTGTVFATLAGTSVVAGIVSATQGTSPWIVAGTVSATQGTSPWVVSAAAVGVTQSTSPWVISGAVSSTQGTVPWSVNATQFAGTTLGATAVTNYGSSPAAVIVPGVNAFVTNTVTIANTAFTLAGTAGVVTATIAGNPVVFIKGNAGGIIDAVIGASTAPTNMVVTGAIASTSAPTPTNGQSIALQADLAGNLRVNPFGSTGSFKNVRANSTGGTAATVTVPTGKKWIIKSISTVIVTSSTAATRTITFYSQDASGNTNSQVVSGYGQTASQSITYGLFPGAALSTSILGPTSNGVATIPYPEIILGPGAVFNAVIQVNYQVADTVQINCNVIELPD